MIGPLVISLLCLPLWRESAGHIWRGVLKQAPLPDLQGLINVDVEHPLQKREPWHPWDNVTATVEALISGKKIDRKFGEFYESLRGYLSYCDFLTSYEPLRESWWYTPATCVPEAECLTISPFKLSRWGNTTCEYKANKEKSRLGIGEDEAYNFVCCPLNGTLLWKEFVERENEQKPERRHTEFTEIPPSLEDEPPYTSISHRNFDGLNVTEQLEIGNFFDLELHKRFRSATVCGFFRDPQGYGESNGRILYKWYPYLCVLPSECGLGKAKGMHFKEANPGWHEFCSQRYTPETNPNRYFAGEPPYLYPETAENTFCCHINDVGNKYLNADKDEIYIATSQIPTYFRLAPGLRSAYKCEEYSKRTCGHDADGEPTCFTGISNPPKGGENPHMASLGVIYPNIMMFHCGGALISLRYIISVASCRYWWGYEVNVALLGEHKSSSYVYGKERVYTITEIVQLFGYPPAFRPKIWQDKKQRPPSDEIDVALYKTDVDVEFNRYIRPACLWHGHRLWPRYSKFLGWGSRDKYRSDYLETLSDLYPTKSCTSDTFYRDLDENPFYGRFGALHGWMMCLKDPPSGTELPDGHRNPCLIDHGGPLQEDVDDPYCTTYLLGVMSSRNYCKRLIPSVFINISQFLGAIEDEVWGKYLFMDMPPERYEKPTCSYGSNKNFFFNKCQNGLECN